MYYTFGTPQGPLNNTVELDQSSIKDDKEEWKERILCKQQEEALKFYYKLKR